MDLEGLAQRSQCLLNLCCEDFYLKQDAQHFHFPPGVANYVASPGGQRGSRGPQHQRPFPAQDVLSGLLPSCPGVSLSGRGLKLRVSNHLVLTLSS